MRLLESSALNQLRAGGGAGAGGGGGGGGGDAADGGGGAGMFVKQRLLMQYIVVSNLHQSLTDFIARHNDGHRSNPKLSTCQCQMHANPMPPPVLASRALYSKLCGR